MESFKLSSSSKPEVSGEMKKCSECLADIPKEARKCSHCGSEQKQEIPPKKVLGVILTIAAFVFMIFIFSDGDSGPSTPKVVTKEEASIIAQRYVEQVLKSPSTADFPMFDYTATDLGGGKFKIVSYVDSQNSFGATVRSDWSVILSHKGGDWSSSSNWKLNEMIFDGELVYTETASE